MSYRGFIDEAGELPAINLRQACQRWLDHVETTGKDDADLRHLVFIRAVEQVIGVDEFEEIRRKLFADPVRSGLNQWPGVFSFNEEDTWMAKYKKAGDHEIGYNVLVDGCPRY